MAKSGPVITTTVMVVVVVVVLHLCPGMGIKIPELCSKSFIWHNPYCSHNQSDLCGFDNYTVSCTHQVQQRKLTSDMTAAECQVTKFDEDCGFLQPASIYTHEKPLVGLRLYHYSTWMGNQSAVNFTFPSPDWSNLKFQYKVNNSLRGSFCREFSLHDVNLPLNKTLVYDCVVFNVPGDVSRDAEVTVENDRGEGRSFIFRVPSHLRIHPLNTSLSEWHVFFYLHQDFIATHSHLPVTVQSAGPFHEVSYKVSIVKCLDVKRPDCGSYATLNYTVVSPKDDEWTVSLPIWSNPGSYAVTVQIVSNKCPSQAGCYVSVSPKFEIEASLLGIWMSVGMGFFLISFLTFLLMFNQRLRTNRNILQSLREVQPSVLLVYLAENQPYVELINMFADFLENTCHLLPYVVDHDVGIQDPNCWTRDHIIKADKVLFMIPGNPDGESITPIRNQWIVALNYLSGHHFTTTWQVTHKVAAVTLPSSGRIPCEILHVYRFKLVDQIAALVTWLHGGTWLDEMFFWRPKIRSSQGKVSYTWPEVRLAALRASATIGKISQPQSCISIMYGNIFLTSTTDQTTALRDDVSLQSEHSTTTDENSEASDSVFDPDIPSFDRLMKGEKDSKLSVNSHHSNEISDSSDDGIFT